MYWLAIWLGKLAAWASRSLGRGHGSALPGLIAEKIYPNFLARTMGQVPHGVILVSGTNGKTTTTKIIAELLMADGYRVFTNASGSNFTRGVISAALSQMRRGKLPVDIAVLELDEAYATRFVDQVKPRYSLLLNVLRDQLDRFGEIDKTAKLLQYVARRTAKAVIINKDDPRLSALVDNHEVKVRVDKFGYSGQASQYYHTDEDIHAAVKDRPQKPVDPDAVCLDKLTNGRATYVIDGHKYQTQLKLFGIHNALNAAAAIAVVRAFEMEHFSAANVIDHLAVIKPAFGRGEDMVVDDSVIKLILVKNPSGFQLSLESATDNADQVMIVINDAYADGRDVSWLWDVSFTKLAERQIAVDTAGSRAYDMAVRLAYDGVDADNVDMDVERAVTRMVRQLNGGTGQIFATYTAMLEIRKILEKMQGQ